MRAFLAEVVGVADATVRADQGGEDGAPVAVTVEVGPSTTTVLAVRLDDDWAVLQATPTDASDPMASMAVTAGPPPAAMLPLGAGADTVEVAVATDDGATTRSYEVADVTDAAGTASVPLPAGAVHAVVATHRDDAGAIVRIDGGSFEGP